MHNTVPPPPPKPVAAAPPPPPPPPSRRRYRCLVQVEYRSWTEVRVLECTRNDCSLFQDVMLDTTF